ncbi:MAG: hypothetical protein ACKVIP_02320 [bacterium]
MIYITDNYRFAKLASIALLTLIISSSADVSAYEEKQVRTINKRVWSIIKGKVKLDKSAYTVSRVRKIIPKVELIEPTPPNGNDRLPAANLKSMSLSRADYFRINDQKEKPNFSTGAKGSSKAFLENHNAVRDFCNKNSVSPFCNHKPTNKYFGLTPKKQAFKENSEERNISYKNIESNKFIENLIKQSNN